VKSRIIFLIIFLLGSNLYADELVVLETLFAENNESFTSYHEDFSCVIDSSGSFWALYTTTREDLRFRHYLKRYASGIEAQRDEIGNDNYFEAWSSPRICRVIGNTLEVQTTYYSDIGGYSHKALSSRNYSGAGSIIQYTGWFKQAYIGKIWKTSDSTASSFGVVLDTSTYDFAEAVFFKNYRLYTPPIINPSFETSFDTLWRSDSAEFLYTDARIQNSNLMAAVIHSADRTVFGLVCVDNEQLLFELDSVLPAPKSNLRLLTTDSSFIMLWREPNTPDLFFLEYNPYSGYVSQVTNFYSKTTTSLEYLPEQQIIVGEGNIFLQVPVLIDSSSSNYSNWSAVVRHSIDRGSLTVTSTDTIIKFFGPQTYINHQITAKDDTPHSMIVTSDGQTSRLYYYGPLNVVFVEHEQVKPESFTILKAFPNPFNPSTTILYSLEERSDIELSIYSINGQEVWKRSLPDHPDGQDYSFRWDGNDAQGNTLPSGIYFINFQSATFSQTIKATLLR